MSVWVKSSLTAVAIIVVILCTKAVWQSGFDQGSDVTLCVIASIQNDGHFATGEDGCKRAKDYERNPLWLLRRRNHLKATGGDDAK